MRLIVKERGSILKVNLRNLKANLLKKRQNIKAFQKMWKILYKKIRKKIDKKS